MLGVSVRNKQALTVKMETMVLIDMLCVVSV